MNQFKRQMRDGRPMIGGWSLTGNPDIAEIMAISFDWVCIDMQHGVIDEETLKNAIARIGSHWPCKPLVRTESREVGAIGRYLDAGASGIIFANVSSGEDMRQCVEMTKYPPQGRRSFALSRATLFGRDQIEYFSKANINMVVVAIIENEVGVEGIDRIVTVKDLDAVMIGPYDLSGAIGQPGNFLDETFTEAVNRVESACKKKNIPFGVHNPYCTADDLSGSLKSGMRFIGCGMDTTLIAQAAQKLAIMRDHEIARIRKEKEKKKCR